MKGFKWFTEARDEDDEILSHQPWEDLHDDVDRVMRETGHERNTLPPYHAAWKKHYGNGPMHDVVHQGLEDLGFEHYDQHIPTGNHEDGVLDRYRHPNGSVIGYSQKMGTHWAWFKKPPGAVNEDEDFLQHQPVEDLHTETHSVMQKHGIGRVERNGWETDDGPEDLDELHGDLKGLGWKHAYKWSDADPDAPADVAHVFHHPNGSSLLHVHGGVNHSVDMYRNGLSRGTFEKLVRGEH
jgi:hypothetical protein